MASFLLPASIQKRLLVYALSRFDLIDTDTLDLEHLEISWGYENTLEFRDVALRTKRLTKLLNLPPTFQLLKARIRLLRLKIPVGFFLNSSIAVEVDGVTVHLKVCPDSEHEFSAPNSPTTDIPKLRRPDVRTSKLSRAGSAHNYQAAGEDEEQGLPTAMDIAASFLQTEPPEERAELEAAMSYSATTSDDGEDESVVGTGAPLMETNFLANMLKGVIDRLQIIIRNITITIDSDVPSESSRQGSSSPTDSVTVQVNVDSIDIQGVTFGSVESPLPQHGDNIALPKKEGKRLISLHNLRGILVSEASLFASLAQSSALNSPSTTQSSVFGGRDHFKSSSSLRGHSFVQTDGPPLRKSSLSTSQNSQHSQHSQTSGEGEFDSRHPQFSARSTFASDDGRFDDASEDGSDRAFENPAADVDSDMGDSTFANSTILDQVTDSHFLEDEDRLEKQYPGEAKTAWRSIESDQKSPLTTPRASIQISRSTDRLSSPIGDSALNTATSVTRSGSIGTNSKHTTFAESRISRSQPLPQVEQERRSEGDIKGLIEGSIESATEGADLDDVSSESTVLTDDELAQSMLFSHEDAESMYMSAMSHASRSGHGPSAWDVSSNGQSEPTASVNISPPTQISQPNIHDNLEHALQAVAIVATEEHSSPSPLAASMSTLSGSVLQSSHASIPPQSMPPTMKSPPSHLTTASSSAQSTTSSDDYSKVSKQIFSLDWLGLYISASAKASPTVEENSTSTAQSSLFESSFDGLDNQSQSISPIIPGAFSSTSAARSRHPVSKPSLLSEVPTFPTEKDSSSMVELSIGQFYAQFDVSVARLLTRLLTCINDALKGKASTPSKKAEEPISPICLELKAEKISIKFLERLATVAISSNVATHAETWIKAPDADVLLRTTLKGLNVNVDISQASTTAAITLQKFTFGYAKEKILSFDSDSSMHTSVRDLAPTAGVDISVKITQTQTSSRYSILTLPVRVAIDLARLDETFSWFGGLSGVLNMGSSIASNATTTPASPSKPAFKQRGVRFETPIKPDDKSVAAQNKVDARIGGLVLELAGKECSIGVDSTAIKLVSRDEGIGIQLYKIRILGPLLNGSNQDPSIRAEIFGTRVEYLGNPKDIDLDRLLSLITPSKAKYDRDDDILLDTLLRQRRQGSVVRVTIDSFASRVSKLEQLSYLPQLGEEVARLSTVAKYLPEDDRPGLLALILVRDVDVKVDANASLGSFRIRAQEVEAAQITLPALVALSVGAISLNRNVTEELIGVATNVEQQDIKSRSPAIMARMIGDEMEPVVKIKLWNLKVEYRVPFIIALLGLADGATSEDLATSIALSVATLTDRKTAPLTSQVKGKGVYVGRPESKAMNVDIGLRDCIIALNPLGLPSKVLMVMTEAHISAVLPKDNNTSATAELSKASLLVIDNVANIASPSIARRQRQHSYDGGSSQVADLCASGYISVSYISSAKAVVHVSTVDDPAHKIIDVELRDDLLVLETCADSTQTLVAALAGLAPPMPLSTEVKYRTKVIPVEDLLASLSGDAFGTAMGNFNFEDDFMSPLGEVPEEEDDVGELDFNSNYYNDDSAELYEEKNAIGESREGSLLFDQQGIHDPDDGVLLKSFSEKQKVHVEEELNFQEDHFGTGSIVEGTAHRWNSARNTYDKSNVHKVRESPLKICVRDVHIIWNLFDGYDWQHTRDTITKAVRDVESKASERRTRNDHRPTFEQDLDDEETVIGDFLFNSIYIGIPSNRDPRELANAINQELNDNATETESVITTTLTATPSRQESMSRNRGKRLKLHRSKHHKITFELKGVNVDLVAFPPGSGETQSSIDVRVRDFDIYDHVPTSTWKKFATYMHDAGERQSGTSQLHLEILNVRPVPALAASEIVLRVTVLPLRLHVDQDALDFITRFFEFKDNTAPVNTSKAEPPFIQRAEVNDIVVRLDFKPKRVDYAGLRSGHTTEFMNFIVLDEADMVLRHTILYGISGFDKLGQCLNDIWMPEIKHNQLPGILAGLAPIRSIANVGGGMRDLIVIPMREYKKDGRIVRSVSKGAAAFARTTGTELIKFGAKLAIGTQTVLQGAEEFLIKPRGSSDVGWEDGDLDEEEKKQISLYADQPIGVVQGLRGAYASLERDLVMARDAIIAVPGEVMESGTAQGAAKAVLRRAPTVILRPVIGASKAISQTLMGATNSLDPQNRRRVEDKYKKH